MSHELAPLVEKIQNEIERYVDSIQLFGSIKIYLQSSYNYRVYVEPTILRLSPTKEEKRPDILIITQDGSTLLEHKASLPNDYDLVEKELKDVMEYKGKYNYGGSTLNPSIVLLCAGVDFIKIQACKNILSIWLAVWCYYYPIDDPIKIEKRIDGKISDPNIANLVQNILEIPLDREETPKYVFIRLEPPLPYTAFQVWRMLGSFQRPFEREVLVSYNLLLDKFNKFYAPWLSRETNQLTPGRLNKALEFLEQIRWIRWDRGTNKIEARITKGKRIADITLYFTEKYAKQQIDLKKKMKVKILASKDQTTLDRYLF